MPGPTVDRSAIYTPQPNELLLVRGEVAGRTVQWALAVSQAQFAPGPVPFDLVLNAQIVAAQFNDALDLRLTEQKASINRLLEHLRHHCPDLRPDNPRWRCDWEKTGATPKV